MQKVYSPLAKSLGSLLFIALVILPRDLWGQCDPPAQLPSGMCQDAPLTCLQDACYSTQPNPPNGEPPTWCGPNTAVHNPQYFLFQATSTTVQINIHVNSCVGGGCGLQAALIDGCPWQVQDVLACDPGTGVGGTMVLIYNSFEVDSLYYLMIDGCSGQICEYTIDFVEGIFNPLIQGDLTNAFTDDPVVCQGWDEWTATANPELLDAHGYLWTGFPWGDGTHTSTYHDMSGPDDALAIPNNAPPGIYEICVVAFTGCDTTENPVCFDLEIVAIEPGESPAVELCPEDYAAGVTWNGMAINGPGLYMQSYMTPEGCPYDSTKEFIEFPEPLEGQIDTVVCADMFTYESQVYSSSGSFQLFYPNSSIYGCDSTASLNLDLIFIESEIDFYCDAQQFVLTSQINYAIPGLSGLDYEWYYNNDLWCQSASCTSPYDGIFELYVSYEINGVRCTYPALNNPIVINLADLVPDGPEVEPHSDIACALDYPTYSVVEDSEIIYYTWTVNPSGVPIFPIGSNDSEIEVNWQGFTGGTICVTGTNECGEGEPTCFDITVIPSPIADFNMPPEVCVDSNAVITFTGVGSPNAIFIWNFGGGTIQSGGTGPGPHTISWGSPGYHTVSLQVAEMGCDTSDITYDIFVEALGQPVVSCNSTLNSVTFEWTSVPGASNYSVTVLGGLPPGTFLNDTTYEITGLTPGTTVQVEVTAFGVGACAATTVLAECIAQSCPPKMIVIEVPSDSFCLGDVTGPIALSATVDGVTTPGTWSGPGVDPAGTFDPTAVGPGQYQIVYMLMEGTCAYQRSTTVYVIDSPTAVFAIDNAICELSDASVLYMGNASVNAVYTWNFGGGTVMNGSGAGPYTVHWDAPGSYSVSLTVEENNCVSEVYTQMIQVDAEVPTPTLQCFATTSSIAIQWSTTPGYMYNVTHVFGPMGAVVGNQYQTGGLVPGDSVVVEIEVVGAGTCPPVIVQASCVAKDCPTPTIDVTPVEDICLYPGTGNVQLEVQVTNGGGSGTWSGPGVVDVNQGIFNPNTAGAGLHQIDYNYNDDGCSFVESIMINVYDIPSASISNSALVLTCDNGNQLDLDGSASTAPGTISYVWTTTGGIISGPTDQATATAAGPGDYTLTIIDLVSMCEDAVTVSVVQDDGVPTADAGPDSRLDCNIQFVVLGGQSSTGPSIEYQWQTSEGKIDSDPTAPTVTVSVGGTYTLIVTDTSNGCVSMDETSVSVDTLSPTGVLSVADILDCDTESTTVSASISPAGAGYTYLWSTADGQIVSGGATDVVTVNRAGTYTLLVTSNDNGCTSTVSIEVFADPAIISDIDAVVDNPSCVGDSDGMIEITSVIGGTPPYTYAWSVSSSGSGLLNLPPGTYAVTVTDANGCSVTQSYVLPAPLPINADIGANLRVNVGDTVALNLTVTDPGSIFTVDWQGAAPPCPNCFDNVFLADQGGDVTVTVTDTSGCVDIATMRLTVLRPRKMFIPNVFSPNDDTVNDYFRISGNTIEEITKLAIFDRWGNTVFENSVPLNNNSPNDDWWDGKVKGSGKELTPGVYVYVAEIQHDDGYLQVVSGDITLVR